MPLADDQHPVQALAAGAGDPPLGDRVRPRRPHPGPMTLDGDLAMAEPKKPRYRVLHAAARLVRGGRETLKIAATWLWAEEIVTAWQRV